MLLPPIPASSVERGDPPGTLLFPSGELLLENLGGAAGTERAQHIPAAEGAF